jgi:hypothetical protein
MSYNNIAKTVRKFNKKKIILIDHIFSWMKLSFMLNVNKKIPVRRYEILFKK